MWTKILLLALAGSAGTLSRYWLSGLMYQALGSRFAYGTLAVNVVGCLLCGFVWAVSEEKMAMSTLVRTVLLVGFLGAFTTFSTFAFETMNYVRDSQYVLAFANVAANCILGFWAIVSGVWLVRLI